MMKALNEKINNLYQSQNKNMGGKGLLWMALIFAVLSCYFLRPFQVLCKLQKLI